MSKPHLDALENELTSRGWRIIARHPGHDYRVSATWEIQRGNSAPSIFIDFDGLGPDGDFCLPVEECYGCHVRSDESRGLYFRRVNRRTELWTKELKEFVQSLQVDSGR